MDIPPIPPLCKHEHDPGCVPPYSVILCATAQHPEGRRWAHLTTDAILWSTAQHDVQEAFVQRVREEVGDDQAPVYLLTVDEEGRIEEAPVGLMVDMLAAMLEAPAPLGMTDRQTADGGREITFHNDAPGAAGGGTLVIPPELLRP